MREWGLRMLSEDAKLLLEQAAIAYNGQIGSAAAYLTARGISERAAHIHLLGYVEEPVIGHEDMQGRLSIPYVTPTGTVDIRFRSVHLDDSPKYLSRSGAEQHIYNVSAFQEESDYIAVCEGELDTIITHSMCGIPAVGMPGSQAWKSWHARAFQDYRKVFILSDGDKAGKEMGKKIMQAIDVAVMVSMPEGMDVNEVYLNEGADGIRQRMGV
jgi:DNA primase